MANKSGRPPGRPPNSTNAVTVSGRIAALKYAEKAMKTLADMLTSPKHEVRVSAANSILDRAYGKPKQEVDANVNLTDNTAVTEGVERFKRTVADIIAIEQASSGSRSDQKTQH